MRGRMCGSPKDAPAQAGAGLGDGLMCGKCGSFNRSLGMAAYALAG